MLERLEISDYRSCLDTTIDLQPDLSILIGPNGSGKTNILNACLLLRSLTTEADYFSRAAVDVTNESRVKAVFRYNDKKSILTAKVQLHIDENNADVILASDQSWYAREFTGNARRIKAPLWFSGYTMRERFNVPIRFRREYIEWRHMHQMSESFRPAFYKIAKFLSDIKYYSASRFTNPSLCPVSFEIEQQGPSRRGVGLRGHSRFLYDLYEAYGAQESSNFEQFFNVIGPDGIGLVDKIQFNNITTSSIDYTVKSGGRVKTHKRAKILVIPQFVIGGNVLSPSQLSEGTFKTITLLFYLMTEQSSALLIEEPEVCVHHGLLSSIVELIKTYSKQKQIIVSTHSDFVLDQVEPRHVYKVTRTDEAGTKVAQIAKTLSSQELAALRHYLDTEGNLGEYWRHGGFD